MAPSRVPEGACPAPPPPPTARTQLLRDELKECYREEGVNHYKNCKGLADAYVHTIRNVGVQKYNAGPWDNVAE